MGDLKIEEIAAAVAQPMSNVRVFLSIWNTLPIFELMADPEATAGPNSPTEPPKPTVNGAAIKG